MWAYVENILIKENIDLLEPETGRRDKNQNDVMNIYFGLSAYRKLDILREIGVILKQKRKYQKRMELGNSNYSKKIEQLNNLADQKIQNIMTMRNKEYPKPLLCFIQFKSMNGLRKFQDAMNFNKLKRGFYICICKKKKLTHKYLNGTIWPKILPSPEPSLILWENLGAGKFGIFVRRVFVSLFSLLLILFGFYAITVAEK